jgi:hypothetical protein
MFSTCENANASIMARLWKCSPCHSRSGISIFISQQIMWLHCSRAADVAC